MHVRTFAQFLGRHRVLIFGTVALVVPMGSLILVGYAFWKRWKTRVRAPSHPTGIDMAEHQDQ